MDNGNPVEAAIEVKREVNTDGNGNITEIDIDTHHVMITGFDNCGNFEYYDPATLTYKHSDLSKLNSAYAITGTK